MIVGAGVLVVVLAAITVVAVIHAVSLEHRISDLPANLEAAESSAEDGHLASAEQDLIQAQRSLASVNSALYNSLDFQVVDLLPVAHQNLAAARASVALGLDMIGDGEEILHSAAPLESADGKLEVPVDQGQVPLSITEAVQAAVADSLSALPISPHPPGEDLLLPQVRSAERRVYQQAITRRSQLQSIDDALSLIDDIAGANGDRRYLIAVSNSAEMRGSGGMYLAYGVITSHAGKVTLDHFGNTSEIQLSKPETKVGFPADFTASYAGLGGTMDWRNVNVMSDFTIDAPVMEAMYKQATGNAADGVIQIDPAGLGALLSAVGPVSTPDLGTVTAANVVRLTLNQAYFLYPNRTTRQDYTGEVAQAAFGRLLSGNFTSLRALGASLLRAGGDRHLLMYFTDPTDESTLRALGLSGALPSQSTNFVQLTVQNLGGNKLDYYLASALVLNGSRPSQRGSRMTATIDLANTAPVGQSLPSEVFGPFPGTGGVPGQYEGFVTLYLPADSNLVSSQIDSTVTTPPIQGSQNGVRTITYTVSVPAGTSSRVVLNLYIPPTPSRSGTFEYVTSPRVLPTQFSQRLS